MTNTREYFESFVKNDDNRYELCEAIAAEVVLYNELTISRTIESYLDVRDSLYKMDIENLLNSATLMNIIRG